MEGRENVRRPNEWKNGLRTRMVEDAWGPPGTMSGELVGTTPTPIAIGNMVRELPLVETDEEYAEYYQDRINESHNKQLYPLMEDLSDWIGKTLDVDYLQGENLFDLLDNGVLLCHLAKVIQEKAEIAVSIGESSPPIPTISARCFKSAARRSFFSRDNTEKFIQFCKKLGVHENLLFESDDLVLQNNPRNVVLCLMEVSRLATRFGVEPPGLVKFEREIAEEERKEELETVEIQKGAKESQLDNSVRRDSVSPWHFRETSRLPVKQRRNCSSAAPTTTSNGSAYKCGNYTSVSSASSKQDVRATNGRGNLRRATSEGTRMNGIVKNSFRPNKNCIAVNGKDITPPDLDRGGLELQWSRVSNENCSQFTSDSQSIDDLDKKVQRATHFIQRHCRCANGKCEKLKIKKIGEGKYTIGGRNVFIREEQKICKELAALGLTNFKETLIDWLAQECSDNIKTKERAMEEEEKAEKHLKAAQKAEGDKKTLEDFIKNLYCPMETPKTAMVLVTLQNIGLDEKNEKLFNKYWSQLRATLLSTVIYTEVYQSVYSDKKERTLIESVFELICVENIEKARQLYLSEISIWEWRKLNKLLKGRHMMVRVGGGWDTLENFLARHDPCQSFTKSLSRTELQPLSKSATRRHSNPSECSNSPVDSLVSR